MAEAGKIATGTVRAEALTVKDGKILCPNCEAIKQENFLRRASTHSARVEGVCPKCRYQQKSFTPEQIKMLGNLTD